MPHAIRRPIALHPQSCAPRTAHLALFTYTCAPCPVQGPYQAAPKATEAPAVEAAVEATAARVHKKSKKSVPPRVQARVQVAAPT